MSRFFIERPIFATVLALVIMLAGGVTVSSLPVAQYPEVVPPTVEVSTVYPGGNAQVVAETVASPIEQEVNGVEDMIYMSSTSASDGSYVLTVTFEVGTNLDMAQVLVQNRVAIAEPRLPEEVKRQGVTTKKKSTAIIQLITLTSPDGRYDDIYLSNFATLRLKDELARIEGVGDVKLFGGADYSMRVWLDPNKLESRQLTTTDVVNAISEQNVQVAAGQIGAPPAPSGQAFQYVINTLGRLSDVEQFEDIIVKTGSEGRLTRIRDVARVELGGETYDLFSQLSGETASSISIYQLPGANALAVAQRVRETMERLSAQFPEGVEYKIPFDTTLFVQESIDGVYTTLFQATLLVFLVIFIFLQDWRASLVPAATIPVSLIGTFAIMAALGFSVNLTTLFGLVLAIGIVVDDAIVVVENTTRHIDDGMEPRPAAILAMEEVTGPAIATTLVLLAVFVPTAFLPGITGQLYRQFGLTISAATVLSTVNALTLSPALCAILLRPKSGEPNPFFRAFNRGFEALERAYGRVVSGLVRKAGLTMAAFGGIAFVSVMGFGSLPTGFLPEEDQGYLVSGVQLPDAASLERTREVVADINEIFRNTPGIAEWVTIGGNSLLDATVSSNAATFYVVLDPNEERDAPALSADAIIASLRRDFASVVGGVPFVFAPPAIFGLGTAGGFQMELQDQAGLGWDTLQQLANEMVGDGNSQSGLVGLNTTFRANVPQLFVDVNRTQAKRMNVPLEDVFGTLQAYLGSAYVNDFNKFGRTYQVRVQADAGFRLKATDIKRLYVRNEAGNGVPMGALVIVDETLGPQIVRRYNLYPSAAINGAAAPGFSSGVALALMEQMAEEKLPLGMSTEWTGISFQEKQVGNEAVLIFALAITLVFLVLAAQYESWTAPASIVFSVPFAILGVVAALMARGMANDVYTQIGVVLLIGLSSKTAILIVEFAREIRAGGKGIVESALEAARLRFRPLLMTTISFVFGTLPLLFASGAGAASQQAVGTAVFGGMLAATFLTVAFVPVFFRVFQAGGERYLGESVVREESAEAQTPPPEGEGSAALT
jgi:HAE1 family hydrophobic/amphiphilic exporter-1